MKVELESTTKIVELQTPKGTIPARLWEGMTANGIRCHAFITRIAVHKDDDAAEFERDLQEHAPPTPELARVYDDARLVV
jgi:hypothetical protein